MKHHYVPKHHLRNFAGNDGKLFSFNKITKRFDKEGKTPTQILYVHDLHALETQGKKDFFIETSMGTLESLIKQVVKPVAALPESGLAELKNVPEYCNIIKLMITMQFWRLPENAGLAHERSAYLLEMYDEHLGAGVWNSMPLPERNEVRKWKKARDDKNVRKIIQFFGLPLISCRFDGTLPKDMEILKNDGGFDFVCSDRPVFCSHFEGEVSSADEIYFPLTKDLIIAKGVLAGKRDFQGIQRLLAENSRERVYGSSLELLQSLLTA